MVKSDKYVCEDNAWFSRKNMNIYTPSTDINNQLFGDIIISNKPIPEKVYLWMPFWGKVNKDVKNRFGTDRTDLVKYVYVMWFTQTIKHKHSKQLIKYNVYIRNDYHLADMKPLKLTSIYYVL